MGEFQQNAENFAAELQGIAKEGSDENRLGSGSGPIGIDDITHIAGNIGRKAHLEIYLMNGPNVSPITL